MKRLVIFIIGCSSMVNGQGLEGIDWGVTYTAEGVGITQENTENSGLFYLDNLDLQFEFSSDAMGLWKGGTGLVYLLSNNGDDPSAFVGDAQVTSNIEANNTRRLYEIWYNQELRGGLFEILIGIHDLNSEFYTNECAGLFNNSSFGIGADVAGNAPVGIFNVAAFGTRLKYSPSEKFSVIAAVYDGDPGDPEENRNGIKLDWQGDQGAMSIAEVQFSGGAHEDDEAYPNMVRVGSWFHTAEFEDVDHSEVKLRGNYGIYASIDRKISSTLSGFFHGGIAAGGRSSVPNYFGFGVNKVGLISSREDDVFGVAVAMADVRESGGREIVIEGVWQAQFGEHLSVKPDVQYVIAPAGFRSSDNVMVYSVRTEIAF